MYIYICIILYNMNKPIEFHVLESAASTMLYPLSSPWSTTLLFRILGLIWRFYGRIWKVALFWRLGGKLFPEVRFSWSQWVFYSPCFFPRKKTHGFFTTLRGTWVPHQCTLFLIMVKVFRSRLSQPKKSLE